ncbi:hypothetical protein MRX96_034108 [Rhipicephalus microplus]
MSFDWLTQYLTFENVCLGVNLVTLSVIYKAYRSKVTNFEAVQTARQLDIDNNLASKLLEEYPNATVVRALIRGQVKAIGEKIKSRHLRGAKAVIQECCLTEHKIQWSPVSRFWSQTQREIHRIINYVPFALTSKAQQRDGRSARPPRSLSHPALVSKLRSELSVLRVVSFVLGCTALGLSCYLVFTWWKARQALAQQKKDSMRREEARKERRKLNRETSSEVPCCVICRTNPVEVMVLECGHVCLCTDCSELVSGNCPMCRSPIKRIVAAFLP